MQMASSPSRGAEFDLRENLRLALDIGYGLVDRLNGISLKQYEPMNAERAVAGMLEGPIHHSLRALNTSIKLLAFLPRQTPEAIAFGDVEPPSEVDDDMATAVEGRPAPKQDRFLEEID